MKLFIASLILFVSFFETEDKSTIDYIVYTDGPRTVYEGTAKLKWDENTTACVEYTFDHVPGRLAGSSISSKPGQPMLPFD